MDLKSKIELLLSFEVNKKTWRNVHDSEEWILANEVAFVVMSQELNRSKNCGCLEDLFIMLKNISKSKIELKEKQMENKFKLKGNVLLFVNGTHYSNANITDEKSIEILKKFPTKIKDFETYPSDWKELTESEEGELEGLSAELNLMEEEALRVLCDELALSVEGLRKLNHKAGKQKMIEYLVKNEIKE